MTPLTDSLSKRWREIGRRVPRAWQEHAERLESALQSIAASSCCDKCQEAALVARAALAGEPPVYDAIVLHRPLTSITDTV